LKENLKKRLNNLKSEFESGRNMLADLEKRQEELQNTLLRISGAIQVLEEELVKCDDDKSRAEIADIKSIDETRSKESDNKVAKAG